MGCRTVNVRRFGLIRLSTQGSLFCLAMLICLSASLSMAQTDEEPTVEQRLELEIFLASREVFSGQLNDPVWSYTPRDGRRLLQLPITLGEVDSDVVLSKPDISIKMGRFVGWRIPDPDGKGFSNQAQRPQRTDPRTMPGGYDEETLRRMTSDPNFRLGQSNQPEQVTEEIIEENDDEVHEEAPRLARSITLTADGKIRWKLDRAIPGAEVGSGQGLYQLALRMNRLAELAPDPETAKLERRPNESTRDYQERRQEAREKLQEDQREYRALREEVRNLPREFEQKRPEYLLVVFDVTDRIDVLEIGGPSPLPWEVDIELFESLQQMSSGRGGASRRELSEQDEEIVDDLLSWTESMHAMSLRATSIGLTSAGWQSAAFPEDSLYTLMERIIEGDDAQAKDRMIKSLAEMVPPTAASAKLLRESAANLSPELRMISLRNLFQMDVKDPEGRQQLIQTANDMLQDAESASAEEVVTQLVTSVSERSGSLGLLVDGIVFEDIEADRLEQVLESLSALAWKHELANRWIAERLLVSEDQKIVDLTLTVLSELEVDPKKVDPRFRAMNIPGQAQEGKERPGPIAIESSRHPFFELLETSNRGRRALAFKALNAFYFPAKQGRSARDQGADLRYRQLMQSALQVKPTPREVAEFLAVQPDKNRAAEGLVELVLNSTEPTAGIAASKLIELQVNLQQIMAQMTTNDRTQFTGRLHLEAHGKVSPVVSLMRSPGAKQTLVPWYTRELMSGEVPSASQWSKQVRDINKLLQWSIDEDRLLSAGAATALVASVGGNEQDAEELLKTLRLLADQSQVSMNKAWGDFQQKLRIRKMQEAAGEYRFSLSVQNPGRTVPTKMDLGRLTLVPSPDGGLAVANELFPVKPDDQSLALLIEKPSELSNIEVNELQDIEFDLIPGPIRLQLDPDGYWIATFTTPRGGRATLRLDPMEESP